MAGSAAGASPHPDAAHDMGGGPRMDDRKYALMLRLHENGMKAMLGVTKAPDWKTKPHTTAYFDCVIGARVSRIANDLYPDAPEPVRQFLKLHHLHELCHCTMERRPLPVHIADKISDFVERVLREHGLVAYLAVAQLGGERSALGVALFGQFQDDPHTTVKGGLDEFYHATTPLLLIAYLNPSIEELETAIRDQEDFLRMMHVPPGLYAPTLELRCTEEGRPVHDAI